MYTCTISDSYKVHRKIWEWVKHNWIQNCFCNLSLSVLNVANPCSVYACTYMCVSCECKCPNLGEDNAEAPDSSHTWKPLSNMLSHSRALKS